MYGCLFLSTEHFWSPIPLNVPFFAGFGSQHIVDVSLPPSVNAVTSVSTLYEMAVAGESVPSACLLF